MEAGKARGSPQSENATFAVTLLCRKTGDRQRDISDEFREDVFARLEAHQAPASWVTMVRDVAELEADDPRPRRVRHMQIATCRLRPLSRYARR
ncbi:MAG: hypothetical protein RID81_09490 [Sandaracinaceae bacterium]